MAVYMNRTLFCASGWGILQAAFSTVSRGLSSLHQSLLVLKWGRMVQGEYLRGVLQKMFPDGRLCLSSTRRHNPKLRCRTAGSDRADGGWCFLSPNQRYNETRKEITTFFQALRSGRKQKSVGNVWPAKSQHRRDYSGEFLGSRRGTVLFVDLKRDPLGCMFLLLAVVPMCGPCRWVFT